LQTHHTYGGGERIIESLGSLLASFIGDLALQCRTNKQPQA
jgi:hypothetical protein